MGRAAGGASALTRFARYAAIDWSGAVGERHRGIAVAICGHATSAPMLVRPAHRWSRGDVHDWLSHELPPDTLVGVDLGLSLPFADRAAFFPEWNETPPDARSLWALVDAICVTDAHLAAGSFIDHPEVARHLRRPGGRTGDLFGAGRGRWRVTEAHQARLGLRPSSNLNLVGAAQVGKASLTGMRVAHRLALPIWPFDPLPPTGSALLEIYTSLAAVAAGRSPARSKMATVSALNAGLAALGSAPVPDGGPIDDHRSDALLTAAWLRTVAPRAALWRPAALSPEIAQTEGWTFGVP